MTTIVTRAGKGSSLSWNEVDANFTNLNTDKAETSVVDLKAPLASPTFTGTVSGITSTMVGLGNVDNTSDATKNGAIATLTNKTLLASTNTVEASSGPNTSQLSFRNILINGEVTRINQRGVSNWAAVSNGTYGYDRWKKVDSSNMTQIIEAGNFKVSTTYTLSGTGVTTQQITSPASGNWTLPNVPITATNVQLEEGSKATPFEIRSIGLELGICQRYFELVYFSFVGYQSAGSGYDFTLPMTPKRTVPSLDITFTTTGNLSGASIYNTSNYSGLIVTGIAVASGPVVFVGNCTVSAEI